MSIRTAVKIAIIPLLAWQVASAYSASEANTSAQMNKQETTHTSARSQPRTHALARITVQHSEAKPYDQAVNPALVEITINEIFAGDIEGQSTVRALEIQHADKSASLISLQRVSGKIGGRQGTFVLQGSETVANGKIKATWFVVRNSGTGELTGLRGEGGFEGQFGKGSEGTLDYWFE